MLLRFCMRAEEWIMAFANCDSAYIKVGLEIAVSGL